MIKIIYCKNEQEVAAKSSEMVKDVVKSNPWAVLGLATGSSPVGMYTKLADAYKNGEISFKNVKTINLDEYVGIGIESDQSYVYFMREQLFSKIDIDLDNTHLPDGLAKDLDAECERYNDLIRSVGGIDLQVLGIGNNGHIGFNEPSDSFTFSTSVIELTDSTIDANSRFFASRELVPTKAISMGIGQIMAADKILLIALGKSKAEILERALFGPITPQIPTSVLRFFKGDIFVFGDEEALSEIVAKHGMVEFL